MLSPAQLLHLALAYGEAEKVAFSTIGKRACGNNKVLRRLAGGYGVTSTTAIALENFFRENWPAGAVWPACVPDPPRRPTRRRRAGACAA